MLTERNTISSGTSERRPVFEPLKPEEVRALQDGRQKLRGTDLEVGNEAVDVWRQMAAMSPLLSGKQELILWEAEERRATLEEVRTNQLFWAFANPDEEIKKFDYAFEHSRTIQDLIAFCNIRLVISRAFLHQGRGVELVDLISGGVLGLRGIIERFNYRLGNRFSSFAVKSLDGYMMDMCAREDRAVNSRVTNVASLDEPIGRDGGVTLADLVGNTPDMTRELERRELRTAIDKVILRCWSKDPALARRNRKIFYLRTGLHDGTVWRYSEIVNELSKSGVEPVDCTTVGGIVDKIKALLKRDPRLKEFRQEAFNGVARLSNGASPKPDTGDHEAKERLSLLREYLTRLGFSAASSGSDQLSVRQNLTEDLEKLGLKIDILPKEAGSKSIDFGWREEISDPVFGITLKRGLGGGEVIFSTGEKVTLSRQETKILFLLMANPGKLLTLEDISQVFLRPENVTGVAEYVRTYIGYLRAKLGDRKVKDGEKGEWRYVSSVIGEGYVFRKSIN